MEIIPSFNIISEYFKMGGFVMMPLLIISIFLWYGLTQRWMSVITSKRDPRAILARLKDGSMKVGDAESITEKAMVFAISAVKQSKTEKELKSKIREYLLETNAQLRKNRVMVRSLVAVAPLLGLLGTVDGMIETFRSLADMALFSQSGGIAGGISKALFTTQMGLAISIPGLLIGRLIERKERHISLELDQIKDLVCSNITKATQSTTTA